MKEKIALASDHAGFRLKEIIKNDLARKGYKILDLGCSSEESVDYPDFAEKLARDVAEKTAKRGILLCGTGIGTSIAANKFPGIYAALCHDEYTARMSREHNDSNVLVLGGRTTSPAKAKKIVAVWLSAKFVGGRHRCRLNKIKKIEMKK